LSAIDFARAVSFVAEHGEVGEIYNIGTDEEYTNLEVATMIAERFGCEPSAVCEFVPDRPFNDGRYSIRWDKLSAAGWRPRNRLADDLDVLVQWYEHHLWRYADLFGGKRELPRKRTPSAARLLDAGVNHIHEFGAHEASVRSRQSV